MIRVGYFGGTFDPIHEGHRHLLELAQTHLKLDYTVVMPAGHPYHKSHYVTPMTYRYQMTKLALEDTPGIVLSDIEMKRRGPSYTLETVRHIKGDLKQKNELYLICGLDVVLQIHLWYQAELLLKEMKIAAFVRPGVDRQAAEEKAALLRQNFDADIVIFDAPVVDISSTKIREDIKGGVALDHLDLSAKVKAFIKNHHLYQKEQVMHALKPETLKLLMQFETDLYQSLSVRRLIHSLDTMYYAIELALRFAVDPDKAAIAALLHDCAREMPLDELWAIAKDVPERWRGQRAFLHGPAAKALIPERFGIDDEEILTAIGLHTTLDQDASDLSKVLFLADKSEPARHFDDLPPIREMSKVDLDQAVLLCLEAVEAFSIRQNFDEEPLTKIALEDLRAVVTKKMKYNE